MNRYRSILLAVLLPLFVMSFQCGEQPQPQSQPAPKSERIVGNVMPVFNIKDSSGMYYLGANGSTLFLKSLLSIGDSTKWKVIASPADPWISTISINSGANVYYLSRSGSSLQLITMPDTSCNWVVRWNMLESSSDADGCMCADYDNMLGITVNYDISTPASPTLSVGTQTSSSSTWQFVNNGLQGILGDK